MKTLVAIDLSAFFNAWRARFGRLQQGQVEGIEFLITRMAGDALPLTHAAYMLATAWHETAATMQPITEYGGRRYFNKYDTGRLAARLGNTPEADGDGYLYRGRGYVQITGHDNYARFSDLLGIDLTGTPDLALEPATAYQIMHFGMRDGLFTGRKLGDYLNSAHSDYFHARRIVNGLDRAREIAAYARLAEQSLEAGYPRDD